MSAKSDNFHSTLNILAEACSLAHADMVCLKNPLLGFQLSFLKPVNLLNRILWKVGVLFRHLWLVLQIWKERRRDVILIQEFSTIPMLLCAWMLFPLRHKLRLINNHNLQWTQIYQVEHLAMRLLAKMGFSFLFFETVDLLVMKEFSFAPHQIWVIPHPVRPLRPKQTPEKNATHTLESLHQELVPEDEKNAAHISFEKVESVSSSHQSPPPMAERPFTVGIIGFYRPDKNIDELLSTLQQIVRQKSWKMVFGCPNMRAFKHFSKFSESDLSVVDTYQVEVYLELLHRCDVVVQNYDESKYFYRASGTLADAASQATAVIIQNYPVQKHQLNTPTSIGASIQTLDELPQALEEIKHKLDNNLIDFEMYCQARGLQAIVAHFNQLTEQEAKKALQ